MQLTHLGHAAVLVEAVGTKLLIDPGNLCDSWHQLSNLDGILITHQHLDHVDPQYLPALVADNPQAVVLVEEGVRQTCDLAGMQTLEVGSSYRIGGLEVTAHGGQHAIIHPDLVPIGNIGLVISATGQPTFFHPGDALTTVPPGIDVLAIPIYGPWAAMKETIDFVRAIDAPYGFPIHEGMLNERGWALIFGQINNMTNTETHDLRSGETWKVPD